MANWLLDYIEMTEYIPSELREQLTSIRELDLQVHNAMDELERDIKQFFSNINSLSPQERQDQYEAFLKKCEVATKAASDKVRVADKLHDLVEKSMKLLDQCLEKLKEDLLEGDKAYVVEDLERKSLELDEQLRLEHETILQRQQRLQELKSSHQSVGYNRNEGSSNMNSVNSHNNHHRHSLPGQKTSNHQSNATNHRNRTNSTGVPNSVGRQKKRERKRLNSTMTIFNRNSITENDSTNQTFLSSPLTPEYLAGLQQNNSTSKLDTISGTTTNNNINSNNINNSTSSSLILDGMMAGNRIDSTGIYDKSNGNDPLAIAKQPILTAIDAAHAVSPSATNSDKLVLFSSNPNGDICTHNNSSSSSSIEKQNHMNTSTSSHHRVSNQLGSSNHLLSSVGFDSGDRTLNNDPAISKNERYKHDLQNHHRTAGPFASLPLSSRHDPIMMAASQAINATQNMAFGRRTSSLKASYAAVNSGHHLQASPNQPLFDQTGVQVQEVYCKCRSHIQGSNMIACDNDKCKIEWFHYECVGITTPPEGEWYCDECRVSLGIQQRHQKQPKLEGVNVT